MTNKFLTFLLQYVARTGDTPAAAQAKAFLEELSAQDAPMAALVAAMPHEGAQSPLHKIDFGLGSSNPDNFGPGQTEPLAGEDQK